MLYEVITDVTEGQMLIDGVDVRSVPVAEFRSHIGLVITSYSIHYTKLYD